VILVVHLGGSRLKWALADRGAFVAQGAVANAEIGTLALREWQNLPRPERAIGVNASGESARVRTEAQLARWRLAVEWIVPAARGGGIVNRYADPAALSPARYCSLVGARRRVLAGGEALPCVVVNAGTSITVDALDASGTFPGGIALPGLHAMLRALGDASPSFRAVDGRHADFPATNADAAVTGVVAAATGAIGEMRERARDGDAPVRCFMTGGAAQALATHLAPPVEVVDNLVIEGALTLVES
jgi:type III pantothenate kinase